MAFLIKRKLGIARVFTWVHFGALGYAWLICLALACNDASAYWGLISMTLFIGTAFLISIRIQECPVLWGPFRFQAATQSAPHHLWKSTLKQTAVMWIVFLVAIPAMIASCESSLGWSQFWLQEFWTVPVAVLVFLLAALVGLWSAFTMNRIGLGTPLPSECARKLVTSGPYRFVRNPMALTGITQGMAIGVGIGSPLLMIYALLGGISWEFLARGGEEEYLRRQFGDEYNAYQRRVRCWLPTVTNK